jgi:hypothetical protein
LNSSQQRTNSSSRIIETIDNIFLNVKSNETLKISTTSFKGLSLTIRDLNSSLFTTGVVSGKDFNIFIRLNLILSFFIQDEGTSLREVKNNETNKLLGNITYGAYLSEDVVSQLDESGRLLVLKNIHDKHKST